jgi:hypothetical protein
MGAAAFVADLADAFEAALPAALTASGGAAALCGSAVLTVFGLAARAGRFLPFAGLVFFAALLLLADLFIIPSGWIV